MQYDDYMKKCFELARQGEGNVSPNPMVGCVVLDKNGNEISNGYHAKCGENHAERNALLDINVEGGSRSDGRNYPTQVGELEDKLNDGDVRVCSANSTGAEGGSRSDGRNYPTQVGELEDKLNDGDVRVCSANSTGAEGGSRSDGRNYPTQVGELEDKLNDGDVRVCSANSTGAEGGTLIVNLEPCSHYGKTPPCVDLIIEKKLARVVIGMRDVNPAVSGIEKLKNAGIEVIEGVLEAEARQLNEVFIKNMTEKKTFIAIKTATTLDGKIATKTGSSKWITSSAARNEVKKIRARYDAIMTTSSTVLADNPTMEHKTKIILDRYLKTDFSANIYQQGKIYVAIAPETPLPKKPDNVEFLHYNDLESLFKELYERKIMSVLVEAGGKLNGDLIKNNLADKIYQFIAPKIVGDNSARSCYDGCDISEISEAKNFHITNVENFSPDILVTLLLTGPR